MFLLTDYFCYFFSGRGKFYNSVCIPGYTHQIGNFCYKTFFDSPKTWSDAQSTCRHYGGVVVEIRDLKKQQTIQGNFFVPKIR